MAEILDGGGRSTVSGRAIRGSAQQLRIPAPGHGRPRLPPEILGPSIQVVRHAVGRHRHLKPHHPRHLLPLLRRHHLLLQLPLRPRHAARDRRLPPAAEEGAQVEEAVPSAASNAGAHLHVLRPFGIPHLVMALAGWKVFAISGGLTVLGCALYFFMELCKRKGFLKFSALGEKLGELEEDEGKANDA
ncbi:hypothetical protein KSP40_PGU009921 [Platanthera guangdongensis]|uniref:Uncharacterized protein n=1 Tax=Platanthera guangdongensis TaxID=2320717 RepID=A0ABR2M435_9ASPA